MRPSSAVLLCLLALGCARPPEPSYTPMTADELVNEWRANPAAAAEKYRTDGVEFVGTLKEIGSNIHGQTYIDVHGDDVGNPDRGTHVFVVTRRATRGLAKCKVGGQVVVRARSDGTTVATPWLVADAIMPVN